MECCNPYESPKVPAAVKVIKAAPEYHSRAQAVRGEVWRGAKLGFKVCLAIWGTCLAISILGFFGTLLLLAFHGQLGQRLVELVSGKALGEMCLSILGIPVASVVFGALPGSLIMGTAAAIHWRRPLMQHTADDMSPRANS